MLSRLNRRVRRFNGFPFAWESNAVPGIGQQEEVHVVQRLSRFALVVLAVSSLPGCQTTVEGLGTRSPAPLAFSKTLVLVDLADAGSSTTSCEAEARFARELPSLGAMPTCLLPFDSERPDRSRLLKSAAAAGYEAILTLKVLSASSHAIPEAVLWEGVGYVDLHTPSSTTAVFGASVFSLHEYRLLWAARITRRNADLGPRDIRSVQNACLKQLRTDGFLE